MPHYSADNVREILQDRDRFVELGEFFIRKAVEQERLELPDEGYVQYLHAGLKLLLSEAVSIVFSVCESPIEKVFVNSLFLGFIKANPLGLVITPPLQNAPRDMEDFRSYHANFLEFTGWYRKRNGSLAGVDEYLDGEVKMGKMGTEERQFIGRHLVFYEYLGLFDRLHLSLQSRFPELTIDGRSLRPDMLVWVPRDEGIRIIVECDGFKHHGDRSAFTNDRKRDRLLKSQGYEVLRYSGSEIHQDPIGTSTDLFRFLEKRQTTQDGEQSN